MQYSGEQEALVILELMVLLYLHIKGTEYFCGKTTVWGFPSFSEFDFVSLLFLRKTFTIMLLIFRINYVVPCWKAGVEMGLILYFP